MFLSICVVVIVLLSVYFMLSCSNTHEIRKVSDKVDDIKSNLLLCKETIETIYPIEKKDDNAVVINNDAMSTAADGLLTINVDSEPDCIKEETITKKRKARKKLISCENCANFIPIKKLKTKKKKEDEEAKEEESSKKEK